MAVLTLIEALIQSADAELWARYCRLAAAESDIGSRESPAWAPGSVEWQAQQDRQVAAEPVLPASAVESGRSRLARRGAPPPFAGMPSPLGAAGAGAFDAFVAGHRGPQSLTAQTDAVEAQLIAAFEASGRAGRYRASGFGGGGMTELIADWFGRMRLDFARNAVVLPDGSEIAAIEVMTGPPAIAAGRGRERPAQAMLRQALIALWARGAFTAGTGNERVLGLALRELGLSPADPPYGFKSAETVRKLRKALKMSL